MSDKNLELRVPDFSWLISKNIFTIPTLPVTGGLVRTDEIEAWVKWAYDCGKSEGINIGLNAKSVITFTAE
jgi:hypothetical protein